MTCVVTARFAPQGFDSLFRYDWNHDHCSYRISYMSAWNSSREARLQEVRSGVFYATSQLPHYAAVDGSLWIFFCHDLYCQNAGLF